MNILILFWKAQELQELDKDEEIGERIKKDLADIANEVWQNPNNAFEKFKTKMKTYKKP